MAGPPTSPTGWWQANDGRWYPPHTHPDLAVRAHFAAPLPQAPPLPVAARAAAPPSVHVPLPRSPPTLSGPPLLPGPPPLPRRSSRRKWLAIGTAGVGGLIALSVLASQTDKSTKLETADPPTSVAAVTEPAAAPVTSTARPTTTSQPTTTTAAPTTTTVPATTSSVAPTTVAAPTTAAVAAISTETSIRTLVATPSPSDCHPDYDPCIPYFPGDALNCADVGVSVIVIGTDPYRLDGNDNDGKGCESYG